MNEVKMRKAFYLFKPRTLLCYTESRELREREENDHPEEIYVEQKPVGLVIYESEEGMTFRNEHFRVVYVNMKAECSKCGAINQYPVGYWHDSEFTTKDDKEVEG